jgi:hypothetical protein
MITARASSQGITSRGWSMQHDDAPHSGKSSSCASTVCSSTSRPTSPETGMEPLWSPVVATAGNQRQTRRARNPRKEAKTVAVGCDRLPRAAHGKEGVDGSSPSEGSWREKIPGNRGFLLSVIALQSTSMPSELRRQLATRSANCLQIGMLPGSTTYLPQREVLCEPLLIKGARSPLERRFTSSIHGASPRWSQLGIGLGDR